MTAFHRKAQVFVRRLRDKFDAFSAAEHGNVALTFGLLLLPIMTAVGAAVDYTRANAAKSSIQSALDAALLAGALDGSSNWKAVATNTYNSHLALKNITAPPLHSQRRKPRLTSGAQTPRSCRLSWASLELTSST